MKIAATSGGLGDIVYSIPVMRELGVGIVYVKENWYHHPGLSLYSAIKNLLEKEGFEVRPTNPNYPVCRFDKKIKYDYNLDRFRKQPLRGKIHIQENMRRSFRIPLQPAEPWLKMHTEDKGYNLIHLTERWRDRSEVDWKKLLREIKQPVFFLGLQYEWLDFQLKYGDIEWWETTDILDMCHAVANCSALYCNQSVALTLAQGLGKEYWLEVKPGKTNVLLYTKNENLLK